MYTRKTRDAYDIEQHTGARYGWEAVDHVETRREAIDSRRTYQVNQPEYPVRIRKVRELINREKN